MRNPKKVAVFTAILLVLSVPQTFVSFAAASTCGPWTVGADYFVGDIVYVSTVWLSFGFSCLYLFSGVEVQCCVACV